MIAIISSRTKRNTKMVLLSLIIFTVLFFLFHIVRFFYWPSNNYLAQAERTTWHYIFTKTSHKKTERPVVEKFTTTTVHGYVPENLSTNCVCISDLRGGYLLPPFPFLKFENVGCEDITIYYISYEFALKSFVLYLFFLTTAIYMSCKMIARR
jgi:hypothetical protein